MHPPIPSLLMGAALLIAGCSQSPPEEAIQARLDGALAAVEARDTGYFRDLISDAFVDARGLGRDDAINRLRGLFLRYPRIRVIRGFDEIELRGEGAAQVVVTAGLSGDQGRPLAGLSADLYLFELEFTVEADGEWRVIGADYTSVRER
jgi:hypothetical protein